MKLTDELRGFKAKELSKEAVEELQTTARRARLWSLLATSAASSGHPGGALSSMDIYIMLLSVANILPSMADDAERDRIVISHGHTSAGFYSALAENGFFDAQTMAANFRRTGSAFQGHVERCVPGIDWGTGNLGQGLSAGVGFALAARARNSKARTWVVMGDGEQVKGQIAEARRIAVKEKLTNLTAIVDWNNIQISGTIEDVMPSNIKELWQADGWRVFTCDGHSFTQLYSTLRDAANCDGCAVVLCRTVMGKGISFMQNTPTYHGKTVSGELLEQAVSELDGTMEMYDNIMQLRKEEIAKGRKVTAQKATLDTGTPHTYTKDDKKDNRGAFGTALAEIGELNYKRADKTPMLVFDCDLAGSVMVKEFDKNCPDSFIEAGIQEHCVATTAGAASTAGVVTVWADFGAFGSDEVYNQQRLNDINCANTKTVLTHSGLDVGEDGMTHQCVDYVGLFRNTYGWKVVVPADPNQTDRITRWMMTEPGCICEAMGRSKCPVVTHENGEPYFAGDYKFEYGKLDVIREGKDVVLLAMGHFANRALAARKILKEKGIDAAVVHCACPLAIDSSELITIIGSKPLVTCEDHNVNSGMGSIVDMLLARAGVSVKVKNMGATHYGMSGKSDEVMAEMKLTPEDIATTAETLLK